RLPRRAEGRRGLLLDPRRPPPRRPDARVHEAGSPPQDGSPEVLLLRRRGLPPDPSAGPARRAGGDRRPGPRNAPLPGDPRVERHAAPRVRPLLLEDRDRPRGGPRPLRRAGAPRLRGEALLAPPARGLLGARGLPRGIPGGPLHHGLRRN